MKQFLLSCLYALAILIATGLSLYSYIPQLLQAEKEPCVRCSEIGCLGGTELCAQYLCRGTLVQCFTIAGRNS